MPSLFTYVACTLPFICLVLSQSLEPYSVPWDEGNYRHPPAYIPDDRDHGCEYRWDPTAGHQYMGIRFGAYRYTVYDRKWSRYNQERVKGGCGRGLLDNIRGTCAPGLQCHEKDWECTAYTNETTGEYGMYATFWLVSDWYWFKDNSEFVEEGYRKGAKGEHLDTDEDKQILCCQYNAFNCLAHAPGARVES
ncbi:hypothetical protein BD289DRAFT_481979 [Coniella lustricola]|uniref:Prokaryotic phospholipase A2-domain-containing protein n=1 Tax=Coniella lustricola TaxID=2025994 RepID=A0A2T3AAJ1_9PEZI|nr:hypothetical protein BD289DRAFT_481979 [Coniella lustricola]